MGSLLKTEIPNKNVDMINNVFINIFTSQRDKNKTFLNVFNKRFKMHCFLYPINKIEKKYILSYNNLDSYNLKNTL